MVEELIVKFIFAELVTAVVNEVTDVFGSLVVNFIILSLMAAVELGASAGGMVSCESAVMGEQSPGELVVFVMVLLIVGGLSTTEILVGDKTEMLAGDTTGDKLFKTVNGETFKPSGDKLVTPIGETLFTAVGDRLQSPPMTGDEVLVSI